MNNSSSRKINSTPKIIRMLGLVAIVCVVCTIALVTLYFLKFDPKLSPNNSDWGTFGDYLGGTLNPIFGLVSTLGLLYTIALQQQQIDRDRQQTTEDKFDDTFFKLLELLNQCEQKIGDVQSIVNRLKNDNTPTTWQNIQKDNAYFRPFFTQLENILQRIDSHAPETSAAANPNPDPYASILYSQLSLPTLKLLKLATQHSSSTQLKSLTAKYPPLSSP